MESIKDDINDFYIPDLLSLVLLRYVAPEVYDMLNENETSLLIRGNDSRYVLQKGVKEYVEDYTSRKIKDIIYAIKVDDYPEDKFVKSSNSNTLSVILQNYSQADRCVICGILDDLFGTAIKNRNNNSVSFVTCFHRYFAYHLFNNEIPRFELVQCLETGRFEEEFQGLINEGKIESVEHLLMSFAYEDRYEINQESLFNAIIKFLDYKCNRETTIKSIDFKRSLLTSSYFSLFAPFLFYKGNPNKGKRMLLQCFSKNDAYSLIKILLLFHNEYVVSEHYSCYFSSDEKAALIFDNFIRFLAQQRQTERVFHPSIYSKFFMSVIDVIDYTLDSHKVNRIHDLIIIAADSCPIEWIINTIQLTNVKNYSLPLDYSRTIWKSRDIFITFIMNNLEVVRNNVDAYRIIHKLLQGAIINKKDFPDSFSSYLSDEYN